MKWVASTVVLLAEWMDEKMGKHLVGLLVHQSVGMLVEMWAKLMVSMKGNNLVV